MAKALTIRNLELTKPSQVRQEIPDGLIRGLYFVMQPTGKASWAVRYRHRGMPRKLTLGTYPAIGLKDARELASRALVRVASDEDPAAEKQAVKATARKGETGDREQIEKVVAIFIDRYAKANTRASSWRETERILKREIVGAWKGKRLSEIRRADVHDLLDKIIDRGSPIIANRTLAAFRRLSNWAVERGIIDISPAEGMKAPAAERSRDRVLSDEELRLVWCGCETIAWPFGPLAQLLILTGQRRDEVGSMCWAEIDFQHRQWVIPKERCKNGVEHVVPLSKAAIAILKALPRIKSKAGLVFTSTGETPVTGFSRAKDRIDESMLKAMRKGADEPEKIELARWTFHDLRRTAASGMARLGMPVHVVEAVLNHKSGTIKGVAAVYNRYSYDAEKRQALEAWSRYVEILISGAPSANVFELRGMK